MEISFNLTITMREVVSINSIYYTIISNGFFSPSFFPIPLPIKAALCKQMVETLKTTLYAVYFMIMTHYANCYVMSRQNKNQTEISEVLECKNDQMTFQKKKAAFFNCVHEAYMCLIAGLPRWWRGNLPWVPNLPGLQFAKSKESVRH